MNPSFGTGSQLLGGATNVTRAMPQPGGSNVLTQQNSPSSPSYQPGIQVQPDPRMPNDSPMGALSRLLAHANPFAQQAPVSPVPANQTMTPPPPTQADTIIEALTTRLKHLSKAELATLMPAIEQGQQGAIPAYGNAISAVGNMVNGQGR